MRKETHRKRTHLVGSILIALTLAAGQAWAAEDISGEWEIASEFNGRQMLSTLTIAKNADGTLTGKWGSSDLSNVKFDGQKLTFVRTIKFGDQEFTMNYAGTLKDGKLAGTVSSDRGEFTNIGTRRKPESPAVGQWDLSYRVQDRDITAKLIVSQKTDGALDAKWISQRGDSTISNVKFQNGKLSFTRTAKFNDNEFEMTFEGAVQGDKLTGVSKNDQFEVAVAGQRFGGPLIGKWELTTTTDQGTRTSALIVRGDLSGRYESFGGEIPVKDLKLEGNQVSFKVMMGFGDQAQEREFKGALDGKTLKGQITSQNGAREVTGKKLEPAPASTGEPVLKPMAHQPDVIFVPTPQAVVDKMLELAEVKPGDVVYDLGCGNGRIVVTAAKKYGVKAVGFDINPERIKESWENVRENHVENLVTIRQEDIFTLDLSQASVITLYLLPSLNVKLMPQLAKCKPGTRIVSHDFDMRGAKPVVTYNMTVESDDSDENTNYGPSHTIYKWVVPWEKE
jgi:hypothetical protein